MLNISTNSNSDDSANSHQNGRHSQPKGSIMFSSYGFFAVQFELDMRPQTQIDAWILNKILFSSSFGGNKFFRRPPSGKENTSLGRLKNLPPPLSSDKELSTSEEKHL